MGFRNPLQHFPMVSGCHPHLGLWVRTSHSKLASPYGYSHHCGNRCTHLMWSDYSPHSLCEMDYYHYQKRRYHDRLMQKQTNYVPQRYGRNSQHVNIWRLIWWSMFVNVRSISFRVPQPTNSTPWLLFVQKIWLYMFYYVLPVGYLGFCYNWCSPFSTCFLQESRTIRNQPPLPVININTKPNNGHETLLLAIIDCH